MPRDPVEDLAALGRLWGTIKFVHPYLAYKDIDWDGALVKTIPLVMQADSDEAFRSAIDHMLSELDDPDTFVLEKRESGSRRRWPIGERAAAPRLDETADGFAVLSVTDEQAFATPGTAEAFGALVAQAGESKGLIFDLRSSAADPAVREEPSGLAQALIEHLPQLLDKNAPLPHRRHIKHSGYAPQTGSTSGGYESTFERTQGGTLEGVAEHPVPIVFLLDEGSRVPVDHLVALQQADRAAIVFEGEPRRMRESTGDRLRVALPHDVTVLVRVTELVVRSVRVGLQPDLRVPASGDSDLALETALDLLRGVSDAEPERAKPVSISPSNLIDETYPDMSYPDMEHRLLALFRFWTIIRYFYPYHDLLDQPWGDTLAEFIPTFIDARDELEYALAVNDLATRMQDTHAGVESDVLRAHVGTHVPPIAVRWIEGRSVIVAISNAELERSTGLGVGDVVLAVDGEAVEDRRSRLGRLFASSTPQALQYRVHSRLLAGPAGSRAHIEALTADGQTLDLEVARSERYFDPERPTPVHGVLPSGHGYMDLERLRVEEVDGAFEEIKGTDAVIFDIRGYPQGTAWAIAPRLAEERVVAARFRRMELGADAPGVPSILRFDQHTEPDNDKWRYTGQVVVLIDEHAVSQSEHTCLFLASVADDITFIGTATNGANGDVTTLVLPGDLRVRFTGHDVRHADGRQLQRVGIQPDIEVAPTIAGIRAGRDEVLERAVAFLERGE